MRYALEYSPLAFEQLQKLDKPICRQILKRLERLAENPELAKPLSHAFKNYRSEHVGKYRVVFSVKETTILIAKIEHRKDAYR
ncbi:MAG: type II toxin-antitoxin system RelE/ParE family toxin [Candidatus Diapherotrites archaeon]